MFFVVVAETWEYRPRRCTVVVYKKNQRGCLPESVVLPAAAAGYLEVLGNA